MACCCCCRSGRAVERAKSEHSCWLFSIRRVEVKRFWAIQYLMSLADPLFSSGSAQRLSQYGIRKGWVAQSGARSERTQRPSKSRHELTSSVVLKSAGLYPYLEEKFRGWSRAIAIIVKNAMTRETRYLIRNRESLTRAAVWAHVVLEYLATAWRQPDEGVWETRGGAAALRSLEGHGLGRVRSRGERNES